MDILVIISILTCTVFFFWRRRRRWAQSYYLVLGIDNIGNKGQRILKEKYLITFGWLGRGAVFVVSTSKTHPCLLLYFTALYVLVYFQYNILLFVIKLIFNWDFQTTAIAYNNTIYNRLLAVCAIVHSRKVTRTLYIIIPSLRRVIYNN